MKKKKVVLPVILALFSFSDFASASSPNFIIKNETHAAYDENEYANVEMIIGNHGGGNYKVPQNSVQTVIIPSGNPPIHIRVDVFYRNVPLANKQDCGHRFDENKLLTLYIRANKNPVDATALIKCEWVELQ